MLKFPSILWVFVPMGMGQPNLAPKTESISTLQNDELLILTLPFLPDRSWISIVSICRCGPSLPWVVGSSALVKFVVQDWGHQRYDLISWSFAFSPCGAKMKTLPVCFLFGVVFNPESRVVTTFCQKSLQCQFGFCILKLKVLHLLHHAQSIVAEGFKNETRCCSLQKMNIEDSGEKSDTTHPGILTPPSTSSFVFCWGFGAITRQQSIVTSSAIKTGSC